MELQEFLEKEFVKEVKKQVWLAGPLISVGILQYSLQVISLMFVGHLGELALSAASLATSFATVTSFTLLVRLPSLLFPLYFHLYLHVQHCWQSKPNVRLYVIHGLHISLYTCFESLIRWDWLVDWILYVDSHLEQNNIRCLAYTFKGLCLFSQWSVYSFLSSA